ncbi:MAG TPA: dipeptidase [Thermoanaerobaculia bacterium]|nr:dipeptidase [Thermoanaerobaculia bacterium]
MLLGQLQGPPRQPYLQVARAPRPTLAACALLLLGATAAAAGETAAAPAAAPSAAARAAAEHARTRYGDAVVATLAELVRFRTVSAATDDVAAHPEFRAMTDYLRDKAESLGLGFADHGAVVVVSLPASAPAGEPAGAPARLGLITHGDVQPADPSKWAQDPFSLDATSEPGRLLGRGTEDDKGPIAVALHAMKALADQRLPLARGVELIVSYTEESDWAPFQAYLRDHPAPDLNVALDAAYPVVVAEKGWGAIHLALPPDPPSAPPAAPAAPHLTAFAGGAFLSQIPEDAMAVVARPTAELRQRLERAAARHPDVAFTFEEAAGALTVRAHGRAAHSSTPEEGRNAITHLAAVLASEEWPATREAQMVRLIDELVGTGDLAERFGAVAYEHPFMGPLTLSLTTLGEADGALVAGINLRRPAGRSAAEVEAAARAAVEQWKADRGVPGLTFEAAIYDPHYVEDAPHVATLLAVFRHYTGDADAEPLAIGGATHASLVPAGVNFGPAMPGEPYTGHSEHEFVRRDQLLRDLEMLTAALVELAVAPAAH